MRPETTVTLRLKSFKNPSFCRFMASSSRSTEVNTSLTTLVFVMTVVLSPRDVQISWKWCKKVYDFSNLLFDTPLVKM